MAHEDKKLGRVVGIPYPKMENISSETGKMILEYRPFSVHYKNSTATAKDLFNGNEYEGRRSKHPELNGFGSVFSNAMEKNIASTISAISQLPTMGWQLDKIPEGERTAIREIGYDVGNGEIWYVPIFEIPVINNKEFKFEVLSGNKFFLKNFEIKHHDESYLFFKGGKYQVLGKKTKLGWDCSIPFYVSGAVFRDGFYGFQLDGKSDFVSDVYFDPQNKSSRVFKLIMKGKQLGSEELSFLENFNYKGKEGRKSALKDAENFKYNLEEEAKEIPSKQKIEMRINIDDIMKKS